MNTEDSEFERIEREAKMRQVALEDDDIQVYKKPWVGLEPEDRLCAKYILDSPLGIEEVIDFIEAKLREKNNG